jgi:hypothetical protein
MIPVESSAMGRFGLVFGWLGLEHCQVPQQGLHNSTHIYIYTYIYINNDCIIVFFFILQQ